MFELKHLKTYDSLSRTHSLAKTAQELFMTDSALSHQIRELESRLGCTTFERKTVPINFSSKGHLLVSLAQQVLPLVAQTRQSLTASGLAQLRLAVECHACFQWLLPVINSFKQQAKTNTGDDANDDFLIEFLSENIFSSEQALLTKQADLVFTSDISDNKHIDYQQIGQFDMVMVMSPQHPLANKTYIRPEDLADQTLITYPVDSQKLDVFRLFLQPADVQPKHSKKVAEANVLLQMVAADLGVTALPQWAVSHYEQQGLVVTKPLSQTGLTRHLYGAFRSEDNKDENLLAFLTLSRERFLQL